MNIIDIKNPEWANVEQTMIDVEVKFEGEEVYYPYTAMVCHEERPTEIFNNAVKGDYGPIAPVKSERYENIVKAQRIKLLVNSDWTQLPDVPQATKEKWVTYRQELRDITEQEGYPFNVTFPEKPE